MISDARVARIALAMSIAGLLLLFFSQQLPAKKTIAEAISAEKSELVSITAKIAWAKEAGKSILFELNDGNKITALFYNPSAEQKALIQRNALLTVIGKISEKQFIVKEVNKVD